MAHNRGVGLGALPLVITLVVAPAQLKIESGAAPATVTVTAPGVVAPTAVVLGRRSCRACRRSTTAASSPASPAGDRQADLRRRWRRGTKQSGEAATATVALVARTEIPVETEAGALVVAVVHGRRSTAHANAAGHARVPAWVWPGDCYGDGDGHRRRRQRDDERGGAGAAAARRRLRVGAGAGGGGAAGARLGVRHRRHDAAAGDVGRRRAVVAGSAPRRHVGDIARACRGDADGNGGGIARNSASRSRR